jgi:hypothetical protein
MYIYIYIYYTVYNISVQVLLYCTNTIKTSKIRGANFITVPSGWNHLFPPDTSQSSTKNSATKMGQTSWGGGHIAPFLVW